MLTFDDLYSFRIFYQDISFDEYYIIKKLKEELYKSGVEDEDEINNHIYNFYQHFNFSMTLNEIKSVRFNSSLNNTQNFNVLSFFTSLLSYPTNNNSEELQQNNNIDETQNNDNTEYTNNSEELQQNNNIPHNNIITHEFIIPFNSSNDFDLNNFINNFNNILNTVVEPNNNQEDVQVTMDKEDINNLPINIYNKKDEINCSICLCDMENNDEYFDIKCKHIFHKDCILKWLEEFNYICPICRTELGKSYAHIDTDDDLEE
jgi:hypothetical protein